ncbi:MAG: TIGR03503 family protein [Parashewanella sp.]
MNTAEAEAKNLETASELTNRFRIDHMVSHVTLFVQREYGSSPVIIVRPDGSKWYSSRHPKNVKWVDGLTGDIISIPNPTAGPWQLIGRVVEGSKIQKISQLNINVQPLPQPLFRGERLKVTANLNTDGQLMRLPGLDYLVDWNASLKLDTDSIVIKPERLGTYKDDGRLLDEYPDDGVFTSNFEFSMKPGKYFLSVKATNEVFARQFTMTVHLDATPITVSVIKPDKISSLRYQLNAMVDTSKIKLNQTHIEYSLSGPAGIKDKFIFDNLIKENTLMTLPKFEEYGSYLLKGTAVSTTIDGREIVLEMPELSFSVSAPPTPGPSAAEIAAKKAQEDKANEEQAKKRVLLWIIGINVFLLISGIIGVLIWRKRQVMKKAMAAAKKNVITEAVNEEPEVPAMQLDDIDLTIPDESESN